MTEFTTPHNKEYQVQHMAEEFQVWNTIETYEELEKAEKHAEDYADGNPEVEIQIVETLKFNY